MKDQEFEYKDLVEYEVLGEKRFARYVCKHPNEDCGHIIFDENRGLFSRNEIRKKRPPFKPGHVIFVRRHSRELWVPRIFFNFNEDGGVRCKSYNNRALTNWEQYALVPNYDYTKDPEMPE